MAAFDIVVLGGGPGGYVSAIRSAQLGNKTAIIDQNRLGGVCLNWGCIPTKALLKSAEILHYIKNSKQFGIQVPKYNIDFVQTVKRSRDISLNLSKGIEFLMKKNKIKHIVGRGILNSKSEIIVSNGKKEQKVQAKKIIIATGGRAKKFAEIEFDDKNIISSKEAMVVDSPPKKLIIIGAGAIGAEFAYFFNEFGSDVHLIEMMPNILPNEDLEISKELEKLFKKSGINIYTGTKVSKVKKLQKNIKVTLEKGKTSKIIEAEKVLVAMGVCGNIEGIGLEDIGIKTDRGSIVINEFNETSVPNIYAIGDVSGPPWLAHVASAQGHVAAEHASGKKAHPLDYSNIPACTYCQPQVASMGLTEKAAKDEGYKLKVGRFNFSGSGKALAIGSSEGFIKIIFDEKYGELLGCHIIGNDATELIAELTLAKALETTWQEIAITMHAHPTLSEAIMEAAQDAYGQGIHQ
ncbi:MAG: dihydrolipoyl dehydrogenase [Candidatus Marinimicrobia bacterium]|nr:dihydrolipoyl dehydrogenase [Candidatus Neomarinimicrobiota bacterium]MBD67359.1 dihydrolipoyl dehydrogenase [Candidatus Neomarinimicrobiota bacterium]|tara:strand:+ start:2100 stop:3488 length:1389 start_codon:yes stop_codon:yes gene_type:complete